MRQSRLFRRLAACLATAAGAGVFLVGLSRLAAPDLGDEPPRRPPEEVRRVEESRRVSMDPANPPRVQVEVDYGQAGTAAWAPRAEAPILRDLVGEGKLPPLGGRMPDEPLVLKGCEGVGTYGGTLITGASSVWDLGYRLSACTLARWSPHGFPIVPHVAKNWEVSVGSDGKPDYRAYAFNLRRGMKWSDGRPFTVEDILFWWTYEANEPALYSRLPECMYILGDPGWVEARETGKSGAARWVRGFLGPEPGRLLPAAEGGAASDVLEVGFHEGGARPELKPENFPLRRLDPYAVRFVFPKPHGLFLPLVASPRGLSITAAAAHYLRSVHPVIGDRRKIEDMQRARRLADPLTMYKFLKEADNPLHPRLWPWIYRTYTPNPPFDAVRNPYYWAVDEQGNQLPYIDRLHFTSVSREMFINAIAAGRFSIAHGLAAGEEYSMIMANRERGDYRVLHWYRADRSYETIHVNLNRRVKFDDPVKRREAGNKRDLLNDVRFRKALSLAINRREVIRAYYNDMTEPAQVAPGPESYFYHAKAYRAYTDYDPEEANRLLDEIGLTGRDLDGMRTFPDGTRMVFFLSSYKPWPPLDFIVDYWNRVGVRVVLRIIDGRLYYVEKHGLTHDFVMFPGDNEHEPLIEPRTHVPTSHESNYAIGFARWYVEGGMQGLLAGKELPLGYVEPPMDHPLRKAMEYYDTIRLIGDRAKQKELYDKIQDIAAENVWTISVCNMPPLWNLVANDIANVPEVGVMTFDFLAPGNTGMETWFDRKPDDSPGAIAQIKHGILEVTPPPDSVAGLEKAAKERGVARRVVRWLLGVAGAAFMVFLCARHPFVTRRLLIMVPTLLIVSVVVFVVIQLPPGDYVDSRIMELEAQGGKLDVEEIARIRETYYLNDPQPVRYARWIGFKWFLTLRPAGTFPFLKGDVRETGLLQGNLGRSMADGRAVNSIVGDRILMTFLISLGTIVFTWAVAIPLGIYSAVRQYSIGDYVLTFLGFLGMCIPSFLLAMLLMFFSQKLFGLEMSGLFSKEYGAQPEWTFGKFMDLLKHIWVPITVMGVTGTAGMIRVMRANLLDELKRPYVVTARAKGVRPLKLLFKYPVRLAMNPFISGIGGLFPALISGGTIVAVVLSLPTVGPLMLQALKAEDMYLAGSMLMVLSLLGIFGVLVSDLLLLWLDPRIRFKSGTR